MIAARRPGLRRAPRSAARGMTLVELAIATSLSVLVLSAVTYAYIAQRSAQRYATELAQIQGNGRVALEQIGRDIRQAGFVGCNSALQRHADPRIWETLVVPEINGTAAGGFTITPATAIRAFRGDAPAATWGGAAAPNAATDSHVIEVRYASLDGATRLAADVPANGTVLTTFGPFEPGRGDAVPRSAERLALLSDCQSAMVVSIASIAGNTVTLPEVRRIGQVPCGHASRVAASCVYWPSTTLYPIRVVQYYIAEQGTAERPDRRLMMRKRVMSFGEPTWNPPQLMLEGASLLRVSGLGLDATAPADPQFRVLTNRAESTSMPDVLSGFAAADWARVARVDLRLRMQPSKGRQAGDPPVIRNFESSYTVRARVTTETQ